VESPIADLAVGDRRLHAPRQLSSELATYALTERFFASARFFGFMLSEMPTIVAL
jgi:hypothetical protein